MNEEGSSLVDPERIDSPLAQVIEGASRQHPLFCVPVVFQELQLANHDQRDDQDIAVGSENLLEIVGGVKLIKPLISLVFSTLARGK